MNSAAERLVRRAQRCYLRRAVAEIFATAFFCYLVLWFVHPAIAVPLYLWFAYVVLRMYWERCNYAQWYAQQRSHPTNSARRATCEGLRGTFTNELHS